jgi:putative membrane protein insertion efficiency factor
MSAPVARAPSRLQRLLIASVRAYRLLFSPWLGSACRFEPTCSAYALESLQAYGAGTGCYLVGRRLLRCHPWCEGGHDPVPKALPRKPLVNSKSPS